MDARYELIARVGKARGLEGKVTASVAGGLPLVLREGLVCHVVPPTRYGPRHLTIANVEEFSGGTLVLGFREVDTIEAAEQVAGRSLLANIEDLEYEAGYEDLAWLIGCRVEDERYGALGTVTELLQTPANDVAVVQGPYGEVLVPLIDEVVAQVPATEDEPLLTHVMDGLVDAAPPAPQAGEGGA